jgi:hypothetical protein
MPLTTGTRLGPYEIVSPLGAGGMGEVYRAKDTRLGRDVAVKVLPASFADDPDRRARFEREAQSIAALSHPNVVAIHDTGIHDGQIFVVMELLQGETLRERLGQGAMSTRKAVDIAVQIARGLGAAHGKGLVHRDLKPENIFLLDDGQVKILDFGLARQLSSSEHSGATQTVAATDPGTVMGTIGYMAPEQVRGQAVDARADVFAFGAVLFEMVGGARAYQRDTAADTMTAILTQEPPELAGSRPELSPALDRIIRHCLEKNANERFQSARDVAFALEALSGSSFSGVAQAAEAATPRSRRALSPVVVGLLVVVGIAVGLAAGRALLAPAAGPPLTFTMKTFEPQSIFNARFMPDGDTIVFSAAATGSVPHLYEIRTGTLEARPFGPAQTHLLAVSSKGELAVLTDAVYLNHRVFSGTLARMTVEGAPRPWLDKVREADWSPDGETIAIIRDTGSRDQLEYPVGTKLYEANGYLSDPRVSPDGSRVVFMEHPTRYDDRGYVKVVDRSGRVSNLAGEYWGEEGLAWSPDGSTVFFGASARANGGRSAGEMSYQIYEVPRDGSSEARFALTSPGDFTIHDIAKTGRWLATREETRYGIVARGAGQAEERDLTWLNKCWSPTLSRDGQRLLFSDGNGGSDYAVVWRKVDGSPVVRLGDGDAGGGWSPDGRWALGYLVSKSQLVAYPIGAGDPMRIDAAPVSHIEFASWLGDAQALYLFGAEDGQPAKHYRLPMQGGRPTPILTQAPAVSAAILSADGTRAIVAAADGSWSVYPVDGGSAQPLVGLQPTDLPSGWTDDGRDVLVMKLGHMPAVLDRLELATGKRTLFKEFAPSDLSSVTRIYVNPGIMKADGTQYAYGYVKRASTLFIVDGVLDLLRFDGTPRRRLADDEPPQSTAIAAAISLSRSRYRAFSTDTSTNWMVPPVNLPCDSEVYSAVTASALSRPMHNPSPQSVNFPTWVRIGPSATSLSLMYSFAVPCDSPY